MGSVDFRMAVCCIGGVCIPYSALLPLVLFILKPILEFLGLYKYLEQFQGGGAKNKTSASSSRLKLSEEKKDSCCSKPTPCRGEYLEDESQWKDIIGSAEPTLVRFTASWCKPCKKLEPEYHQLMKDESSLRSISLDIDELEAISAEAKVNAIPCFHVYRNGNLLKSWVDSDANTMRSMVNEFMDLKKSQ